MHSLLPLSLLLAVSSECFTGADAFQVQPFGGLHRHQVSLKLSDSSPSDVADDDDVRDAEFTDGPVKSELLSTIDGASKDGRVVFGFGDSADSGIPQLCKTLENKYVLPLEKPSAWKLLYTNAPDLLGFEGGPLSQLETLSQELSTSTLTLKFVYKPSDGPLPQLLGNVLSDLEEDRLTQKVVFEYEEKAMNAFNLKMQSTVIESSRFGSLPELPIPSAAPFVEAFKVIFNDGDLRMERTVQGDFLAIYKRMD